MKIQGIKGQNAIEYLLLFAIVVVVLLVALGPNGFFSRSLDTSIDLSTNSILNMAESINYENR